ncbi:MAG: RidA family protein [Phenylobacterium sp.]
MIAPGGRPLPLSSAIETGDLLVLSGQLTPRDGQVFGDIAAQPGVVLDGIEAILKDAGLTLNQVVKTAVWLTDPQDFAGFDTV